MICSAKHSTQCQLVNKDKLKYRQANQKQCGFRQRAGKNRNRNVEYVKKMLCAFYANLKVNVPVIFHSSNVTCITSVIRQTTNLQLHTAFMTDRISCSLALCYRIPHICLALATNINKYTFSSRTNGCLNNSNFPKLFISMPCYNRLRSI